MNDDHYERRRPEHWDLPGHPRIKLIREVRRTLWSYLRCRPNRDDTTWKMAWEWAYACGNRNSLVGIVKNAKRTRWPSASEIASQYILLALADMRGSFQLRVPFRATECVPLNVRQRFASISPQQSVGLLEYTGSAPVTAGERPDLTA